MAYHKDLDPLDVVDHPPCMHLRSKGMYVTGEVDPTADPEGHDDQYCWCNLTQRAVGPDDGMVERQDCTPARRCFRTVI